MRWPCPKPLAPRERLLADSQLARGTPAPGRGVGNGWVVWQTEAELPAARLLPYARPVAWTADLGLCRPRERTRQRSARSMTAFPPDYRLTSTQEVAPVWAGIWRKCGRQAVKSPPVWARLAEMRSAALFGREFRRQADMFAVHPRRLEIGLPTHVLGLGRRPVLRPMAVGLRALGGAEGSGQGWGGPCPDVHATLLTCPEQRAG